jgi:hypothetical protein
MTIPLNVPSVIRVRAAFPGAGAYIEAINRAVFAHGTYWEVLRYVPNGGVVLGMKDPSQNQRIWIRYNTSGRINVNLDPDGRAHDPDLSLTNAVTDFVNFSGIEPATSPAVSHSCWALTTSIVPLSLLSLSPDMDIIETDDCFTFFIHGDATNSFSWGSPAVSRRALGDQSSLWFTGVQMGKIFTPDNPLEEPLGIDGYGIVTGWPGASAQRGDRLPWLFSVSDVITAQNAVRVGPTTWSAFYSPNCASASTVSSDNVWRTVDGKVRPIPATIAAKDGQVLGRSKYFRLVNRESTSPIYYEIDSAITDGQHQAWIQRQYLVYIYDTASNLVHLWTTQPIKYA